jgi:pimeloyl-ACP methyl ester carboxylesterase
MQKTNNDLNWLNRDIYPFKSKYFEINSLKMHYIDEGEGETIVFVHGNPNWSFEFRYQIQQLSRIYRCVAPDHIGFGLSDKPKAKKFSYNPQEQAANFEKFIENLDLRDITLVVGDWGGPIGLFYALKHPENVKKIVIQNTWLWSVKRDWYYQLFSRSVGGFIGRFLTRRFNFFARVIIKQAYGDKKKLTKEVHNHYKNQFKKPSERIGCSRFPMYIIGESDWLAKLWQKRDLLQQKPILILWGMKDIAFREKELNQWMDTFPDAKIVRYDTVGHYPLEEFPEDTTKNILSFMQEK